MSRPNLVKAGLFVSIAPWHLSALECLRHMPSIQKTCDIHFHSEGCSGGIDSRHKLIQFNLVQPVFLYQVLGDYPFRFYGVCVKRVDKESGACYDADEFFRLTRPRYPESVVFDGRVIGYDNEMVIRYLDKVIVNDQDYEVRFKGGITVTV